MEGGVAFAAIALHSRIRPDRIGGLPVRGQPAGALSYFDRHRGASAAPVAVYRYIRRHLCRDAMKISE